MTNVELRNAINFILNRFGLNYQRELFDFRLYKLTERSDIHNSSFVIRQFSFATAAN